MVEEPAIIIFSSYLILALMLSLRVYLGLRTVLFGIVLPEDALKDPSVRAIRRNYALLTAGLAAVIGGACLSWLRHQPARALLIWTASLLLIIAASFFTVWLSRRSVQRLKTARGWQVVRQTKRAASLAAGRNHRPGLSFWWYSANAGVMAICTFCAIMRWDQIPHVLHLGMITFYKTWWTVFMLNITQALNITVFVCYHLLISRARTSLDPHDRKGSLQKQLQHKKIHSLLAWGTSFLMVVFYGVAQASALYRWKGNLLFLSGMSLCIALLVALTGVILYMRIKGIDQLRDIPSLEERHWKWLGSIYVNPEDPALIVPNNRGFGWTVNLANPRSKIIAAAIITVPVLDTILAFPLLR
ncbi:DUF5808 domain-containing protein [Paenibacillus sp. MMS20-IR301]|uniref:DUF5808 domain-containing protein n=1 Tax=Paenibacillus sp. MMS20-IR301 TaxID=2895946 RepID=UPI0028E4D550|nr:DUF5808 domain-containing protein [Paenibacillus sp. MMS20-IR301]WNS44230.1 DUF5808 domain-containing protein [Paenibacillus sp. MMS20-IR301]